MVVGSSERYARGNFKCMFLQQFTETIYLSLLGLYVTVHDSEPEKMLKLLSFFELACFI